MIPRARGDVVNGRDEVQVVSGQAGVRASGSDRARVSGSYEVRVSGVGRARVSGPHGFRAGTVRLARTCESGPGEVRAGGCGGIRAGEGSGDRGRGAARTAGEGL